MEQAIAFIMVVSFLGLGLSYLIRMKDWDALLITTRELGRRGSLIIGMINVFFGSFIVGFHWKWQGLPIVLTLIGAGAILKGFFYLLFPEWLPKTLRRLERYYRFVLPVPGVILIALSLVVFCEWLELAYPNL